jgi:hypothetical protein
MCLLVQVATFLEVLLKAFQVFEQGCSHSASRVFQEAAVGKVSSFQFLEASLFALLIEKVWLLQPFPVS